MKTTAHPTHFIGFYVRVDQVEMALFFLGLICQFAEISVSAFADY